LGWNNHKTHKYYLKELGISNNKLNAISSHKEDLESISLDYRSEGEITQEKISEIKETVGAVSLSSHSLG
jgi:hypothetical protein